MEKGYYGGGGGYGYALVVDGVAIRGLKRGPVRREPLTSEERESLAAVLGRARSRMRSAYDVATDGECYYVTVRQGGQIMQFGRAGSFLPATNPSFAPRDDEELVVSILQKYADDQ